MTDPERIAQRSLGLAGQLIRAGADEQPGDAGLRQTLTALGVSAAVVSSAGTVSAAAGGVKAAGALGAGGAGLGASAASGTVTGVSATLLLKWIGLGVVGGVGLAGAAAVVTTPASPAPSAAHTLASAPRAPSARTPSKPTLPPPSIAVEAPPVDVAPAPLAVVPRSSVGARAPASVFEVGAPLAAEVSYVDRARGLLAAGQAEQGLLLLQGYEREFPEARLLPEVLFLRLETCDRLGRKSEARSAAQRLLDGFPKSPHASRARKLLFP